MSQPDPTHDNHKKSASPVVGCALGTIGLTFLVLGVLITVTLGLCTTTGGSMVLLYFIPVIGGPPLLIGAALVDAARYFWGRSSGRFGKVALLVSSPLILLGGLALWIEPSLPRLFGMTGLEVALAATVMAIAFLFVALHIKPRS